MVDAPRIELGFPRCERGVLPLNYRPIERWSEMKESNLRLLLPSLADPVAALLGLSEDRSGLRLGVSLNMCDDLFSAFHSFSHPMPIRC